MARWFPPRDSSLPFFCVVGQPIAHSKSPQIHRAFAVQTGRVLEYVRAEVAPGALADAVAEFRAAGGVGMNVTLPLKEEALGLAATSRPRARMAGAANTLWFELDGCLAADNTDGVGLVRDLECNHGLALAGQRILVLGAGGAARGVVPALREAGAAAITVSNRSPARAVALVEHFEPWQVIEVLPWGGVPARPFDVVVNATSSSLGGVLPALAPSAVRSTTLCYDMAYGDGPTPFQQFTRTLGVAHACDGLGMLVEQAAAAFEIWHGIRPATAPVIEQLRARLAPA